MAGDPVRKGVLGVQLVGGIIYVLSLSLIPDMEWILWLGIQSDREY